MKKILHFVFLFFVCNVIAQDISLDDTFNVPGNGFAFNAFVQKVLVQPDGKILVGGGFTSFNGVTRNRILRLNIDGTLDESFDAGVGPNNTVISIALDSSGKIYIGGAFTTVNGLSRKAIARLNSNGSLDTSFWPSFVTSDTQDAIVRDIVLSNDKVLVAGDFRASTTPPNGVWAIARFNLDGSYDTSFTPPMDNMSVIHKVLVQSDGKILVGGFFTFGVTDMGFARLNSDGTKDLTFNSINTIFGMVYDICLDNDNKILIGGVFTDSFGGSQMNILARINTDGSIDSGFEMFNVDSGNSSVNVVNAIELYNGKILIGGQIPTYNGNPAGDLMLIDTAGVPVSNFNIGTGFESVTTAYLNSLAVQGDNKIIAAGQFTSFDGSPIYSLARLAPTSLGKDDFSLNKAYVYYSEDFLHINSTEPINTLSIYDFSGKLISSYYHPQSSISVAEINQHLLIVDILFDNGSTKTVKLLK